MNERAHKILFPFFKERHKFIQSKPWFRLLLVLFIIFVIVTPIISFLSFHDANSTWCWDRLRDSASTESWTQYNEHSNYCMWVTRTALWESLIVGIVSLLGAFYLTQVIFFSVILDFIVIGVKNNDKEITGK